MPTEFGGAAAIRKKSARLATVVELDKVAVRRISGLPFRRYLRKLPTDFGFLGTVGCRMKRYVVPYQTGRRSSKTKKVIKKTRTFSGSGLTALDRSIANEFFWENAIRQTQLLLKLPMDFRHSKRPSFYFKKAIE